MGVLKLKKKKRQDEKVHLFPPHQGQCRSDYYHEKYHIINKNAEGAKNSTVSQQTMSNIMFSREVESQSLAGKQLFRRQHFSPPLCCTRLFPNGFQSFTKNKTKKKKRHNVRIHSPCGFLIWGIFHSAYYLVLQTYSGHAPEKRMQLQQQWGTSLFI